MIANFFTGNRRSLDILSTLFERGPLTVAAWNTFKKSAPAILTYQLLRSTLAYDASKAAIYSFTESMRVQLADASIWCLELALLEVRATLINRAELEPAMPREEFVAESISLLKSAPESKENIVNAAAC